MLQPTPALLDTIRRVETPEGVELSLRVAGPVARALAWGADSLIKYGALWGLLMALAVLDQGGFGLWLIALFLTEWFYPALFEVYAGGATPGKKALGLKVIHADGTPVDWPAALIRNLLRAADFLPVFYGFGLTAMLCNRDFQRLGRLRPDRHAVQSRLPAAGRSGRRHRGHLPRPTGRPAASAARSGAAAALPDESRRTATADRLCRTQPYPQSRAAGGTGRIAGGRHPVLADATRLHGITGVERLRAHARWLVGDHA